MSTDGGGVTALVCAKGCPLDCKYCINPKSKPFGSAVNLTPGQLYEKVKIDSLYYIATGGGVTFGGGEPLLHTGFISGFKKIIPEEWKIYAESSLFISEENVYEAAGIIDHFYIDIKDADPGIYRSYTGRDNAAVMRNLKILLEQAGTDKITVRVPLIPGYNTDEDRKNTVEKLKKIGITDFDLFSYKIPIKGEKA